MNNNKPVFPAAPNTYSNVDTVDKNIDVNDPPLNRVVNFFESTDVEPICSDDKVIELLFLI